MTLSVRTSLLATAMLLVLATQAPVMAEYEEEEDMDMDLLLDVLRRTRGKQATVAAAPSAQAPVSPVSFYREHTSKRASSESVLTNAPQHCSLSDGLVSLSLLALLECRRALLFASASHSPSLDCYRLTETVSCVRIWQTALTRLIESLSETDAGEAEKLTSLLRGADKEHPSSGNRASMEIQEGTAAARQRATSKRSSGSGAKKKAHNAGAHILEEGIGKGTHTGRKYRKDSVDRESIRTREKYQRTQADRVRTCYKEGKAQVRLLSSRDLVTTSNITWEVPCALKFYQDAYGVIPGKLPSLHALRVPTYLQKYKC